MVTGATSEKDARDAMGKAYERVLEFRCSASESVRPRPRKRRNAGAQAAKGPRAKRIPKVECEDQFLLEDAADAADASEDENMLGIII